MGRTYDPQHLLDINDEQNIGNSIILQPQAGAYPAGTYIPETNPPRLLNLSGPSKRGQTTSVIFTASRVLAGTNNPNPGFAGPITGVVEFGSGGRFTRIEVDVPVGPYLGMLQGASSAVEPQDGGSVVTVPTSVLRAYCRYDNLLIQPGLGTAPYTIAERYGQPLVGPGGPHNTGGAGNPPVIVPPEPVLVKAFAAYFSRHFSRAYKTQYCYIGDPNAVSVNLSSGNAMYCIPPHAKSIKVLRYPMTAAIDLQFWDGINPLQIVNIAASASPITPIEGTTNIVQVLSHTNGAADNVTFLALVYEIGF